MALRTMFLISTFSCARLVMASAALLAAPPLPGCALVTVLMRCSRRSRTRPGSALHCAMRDWYSGLTASRPRMKLASFSSSSCWLLRAPHGGVEGASAASCRGGGARLPAARRPLVPGTLARPRPPLVRLLLRAETHGSCGVPSPGVVEPVDAWCR